MHNSRQPPMLVRRGTSSVARAGAAALDYILAIGVVLPLLAVVMPLGRKAMRLVYEMTATLVSWPFM